MPHLVQCSAHVKQLKPNIYQQDNTYIYVQYLTKVNSTYPCDKMHRPGVKIIYARGCTTSVQA